MSKIKIFGLGGLNENGKDMYITEVDNDIFIFDAGLKFSNETMLGVDYVIPNFTYLKENRTRIKGLFLTHGHIDNIGSATNLLKEIPELKVYATKFTLEILKNELADEKLKDIKLVELLPKKELVFGQNKILPVAVTHSIPGSVGYALITKDGVIFYTGDFLFDPRMPKSYEMDLESLTDLSKKGVLCLLSESVYAGNPGFTSPHHRLNNILSETFVKYEEKRIIFTVFANQIHRIQELFDNIVTTKRKVVIMGHKLQALVNNSLKLGYLKFDESRIGNLTDLDNKNTIILLSNEKDSPFSHLEKILAGYDKYIKVTADDLILIAQSLEEGNEKKQARIMDEIARIGATGLKLSSKRNLLYNASREDLMLMIKMLKPKYYFPVKGEYRFQWKNKEAAMEAGIAESNILLKQNGEVSTFENGVLKQGTTLIPADSVLIDGKDTTDIGELVLKDREILSDDGIVIVSATVHREEKKIKIGPEVLTKGFIYVKNNIELLEEVKKQASEIININMNPQGIEHSKIKTQVRDKISRYLYKETGSNPMIITVINEIS